MDLFNFSIPQEQVTAAIQKVNTEYRAGKITRKQYLAKFSKAKNQNSFSSRLKRYGAKVTKTKFGYKFQGRHITGSIFLDACERDYWTIDQFEEGTSPQVVEFCEDIYGSNQFETKQDAIATLLQMDLKVANA